MMTPPPLYNCQNSHFVQIFGRGLNSPKKGLGFTLAEVLITLAIIGIVAALTIPTLITNYQKNQYVTQLKKNYNVIQNGFRQYMASQGVTKLTDTKLFNLINGEDTNSGNQSAFQAELNQIFKITKQYGYGEQKGNPDFTNYYLNSSGSYDNGYDYSIFFLTDGSTIFYSCNKNEDLGSRQDKIKKLNGKMKNLVCMFEIDVNGAKKPNTYGRDVFGFDLDNQGTLFPWGGRDEVIYGTGAESKVWNSTGVKWNCRTDVSSQGIGCASRIIEDGWKMNY